MWFGTGPSAQAADLVARWISGNGNWSNPANWNIGVVPNNAGGTNYDVVINAPATNATITMDQSVTVNSLSNADTVVIASGTNAISQWTINSGSIQMTGALAQLTLSGSINNPGQMTATTGTLYLTSATLTCTNTTSRVTANCPGSLTAVDIYAANGAIIAFSGATNYTSGYFGNTIQASGAGSRIDLSSLAGFVGASSGATQIAALNGGEVDLGGQFSGGTAWTLQGAGSVFNAANLTALSGASLNVTNGLTLTFAAARALTNVNLNASGGGVISFPSATNYTSGYFGNTIQASGAGSRIDLSSLAGFVGASSGATQIAALNGGEVDLGGQFSGGTAWTLQGAGSVFNAANLTALSGASLNVTNGLTLTFAAARALTNVNLNASGGGVISFPSATNYTSGYFGNTIQASGAGSRIDLSSLAGFVGASSGATQIAALNGGEVDLGGQFSSGTAWTLQGAGSVFNAANLTALSGASLNVTNGLTLTFAAARALTNVNLNASGGGVISFPSATNYTSGYFGNTIQASGAGSRIDLSSLAGFVGASSGATQIAALNGGEVDLGGQFSGGTAWTLQGAGSVFNAANLTALSGASLNVTNGLALTFAAARALTNVNLNASGGGVISFPSATNYTSGYFGNTIQASGAGSRIDLSSLAGFVGASSGATQIAALNGGEVDLGGQFSGGTAWTLQGAGSVFNAANLTALSGASLNVTNGLTLTFAAARALTNVNLNASGGGVISFPSATNYTSGYFGNTIQASGAGSRIDLSSLAGFVGASSGPPRSQRSTAARWTWAASSAAAQLGRCRAPGVCSTPPT